MIDLENATMVGSKAIGVQSSDLKILMEDGERKEQMSAQVEPEAVVAPVMPEAPAMNEQVANEVVMHSPFETPTKEVEANVNPEPVTMPSANIFDAPQSVMNSPETVQPSIIAMPQAPTETVTQSNMFDMPNSQVESNNNIFDAPTMSMPSPVVPEAPTIEQPNKFEMPRAISETPMTPQDFFNQNEKEETLNSSKAVLDAAKSLIDSVNRLIEEKNEEIKAKEALQNELNRVMQENNMLREKLNSTSKVLTPNQTLQMNLNQSNAA